MSNPWIKSLTFFFLFQSRFLKDGAKKFGSIDTICFKFAFYNYQCVRNPLKSLKLKIYKRDQNQAKSYMVTSVNFFF